MSTIYEDIQALRERFKIEYGLDVIVEVRAHSHNNELPGYPARQTVDLACKSGVQVDPSEHRGTFDNGTPHRWFKFADWRNGMEIVLHG